MIQVEQIFQSKYPALAANHEFITRPTLALLRQLLREQELNAFLLQHHDVEGREFLEKLLAYCNLDYSVVEGESDNIPAEGRVVIVANHPLGGLDGVALLKLVRGVRPDVRIVANDVLMQFGPLRHMLLPIDNMGKGCTKASIAAINEALGRDEAVIVFPSGEVSRPGPTGIKDRPWRGGFLRFAERAEAPVLPIHIEGRNSALFYGLSMLYKPLSTILLVHEMFRRRQKTLHLRIGELIPWQEIAALDLSREEKIKRIHKQVYSVSKKCIPLFRTAKPTAQPEARPGLRRELHQAELLGQTKDGKQIFLYDCARDSSVMREIGRLREIAFRRVREGSGKRRDLDQFDAYYRHLVLWDDNDLQIVGAYRVGESARIVGTRGTDGLYTNTLFAYSDAMHRYFPRALELGRSFVQPRYWGMRSLDYLWYGIGAYLRKHPDIRYLFGPVSISDSYPRAARNLLVHFYRHYFGDEGRFALARERCVIPEAECAPLRELFDGFDYEHGFRVLKEQLGRSGLSVPTLYKQYTEVCEPGGARFLDFGVDAQFANCVDGLVLVDLELLKSGKRARYIDAQGGTRTASISRLPDRPLIAA
ncbi:MAG: lysophospholipid acyltransferase family protein [Proteobacteria bacterium]|nr:lysophospholipid acyltransferase family protein [Pseudomonadota bacterium]